jgi:CRP-like cAMP-binding protein
LMYEVMKPVTLAPGTEIMRQGADGDEYIVIESGEADVYVASQGQVCLRPCCPRSAESATCS